MNSSSFVLIAGSTVTAFEVAVVVVDPDVPAVPVVVVAVPVVPVTAVSAAAPSRVFRFCSTLAYFSRQLACAVISALKFVMS